MASLSDLLAAGVFQVAKNKRLVGLEVAGGSDLPTPPSLLWKAYALAIRPHLSLAPDLSALNQAMFLASPLQAGIPANSIIPEGVTNYQQYLKADCMQIKNQPFYSLENDSYFEQLWKYLRNVQTGPQNDKINDVRSRLDAAKAAKDRAFDAAFKEYEALMPKPQDSFINWLRQNGTDYKKSWDAENALEQQYERLQDGTAEGIMGALATMKSADSKIDFKVQNNMPCIIADRDYFVPFSADPAQTISKIDPNSAYYRPYHMLSSYRDTAQRWIDNYAPHDRAKNRTTIFFDFDTARTTSWKTLGHDGFGQDPAAQSTDDIYSTITASLSWTGLKAFDVDRGLWDVKKPHDLPLGPEAAAGLKQPFYRITKLLLGYGVDLTLTLGLSVQDVQKQAAKVVSVLGVPVTSSFVGGSGNELHVSAGDDAYPVLLAVIAQAA